ncbi:MAG: MoxR family ATPase [Alicyclobacillus sp.]|nr:MoxR family ATPase [Alicyclobacillus sp.]
MAAVQRALAERGYVADRALATAVFLALALERPLFLEGEAGVGKTELAKALADAIGRPLVRLQCYEGIDREHALYEWNYARQLLHIRIQEAAGLAGDKKALAGLEEALFSPAFLLRRPLLQAIDPAGPAPVLLIDEVDRGDEAFEAFLLEVLGEFQVTIPELGTLRAAEIPVVMLTSNRTREVHDALKRRCLYHWVEYPDFDREYAILTARVPDLAASVAAAVCRFVQRLRQEPLMKRPGIAETLHWGMALAALGVERLEPERVEETIGCLIKYKDDLDLLLTVQQGRRPVARLLAETGGV